MYYTLNDFDKQYDIANEGLINSIKTSLKKMFLNIVVFLEGKVSKCRDSKLKRKIMGLLARAKAALSKVDNIKTNEDAQDLQEEAEDIKEGMEQEHIVEEQRESPIHAWRLKAINALPDYAKKQLESIVMDERILDFEFLSVDTQREIIGTIWKYNLKEIAEKTWRGPRILIKLINDFVTTSPYFDLFTPNEGDSIDNDKMIYWGKMEKPYINTIRFPGIIDKSGNIVKCNDGTLCKALVTSEMY